MHHVDLCRRGLVKPHDVHRQDQCGDQSGATPELPAKVAVNEKHRGAGRQGRGEPRGPFADPAKGPAKQGDSGVHPRRLREERLAIKHRHQPVAAAQKAGGDDGAQTLIAIEVAGAQTVEEEKGAYAKEQGRSEESIFFEVLGDRFTR